MLTTTELSAYLNDLLNPSQFRDYAPNGLQVQGKPNIKKIITGVTACLALIDKAIAAKADAILVHHGYFWKNESAAITGIKKNRVQALLKHDINLFAYHLPLDAHLELGNNIQLASQLGLAIDSEYPREKSLIFAADLPNAMNADDFSDLLFKKLGRQAMVIPGKEKINRISFCTGAAQSMIEEAYNLGFNAYLSGEISESTVHFARETGMHFFAAGHHATERYGIKALGQHLQHTFDIKHEFIDIDNPV